jgi:hypothetical protein
MTDVCSLCGSDAHTLSQCPWKKTMKIALLALVIPLAGCAGLHVAWVVQASYNTPAVTNAVLAPAAPASAAK